MLRQAEKLGMNSSTLLEFCSLVIPVNPSGAGLIWNLSGRCLIWIWDSGSGQKSISDFSARHAALVLFAEPPVALTGDEIVDHVAESGGDDLEEYRQLPQAA